MNNTRIDIGVISALALACMTLLGACQPAARPGIGCTPGAVDSCACAGGGSGVQTCTSTGTFGACLGCSMPADGGFRSDARPTSGPVCGNRTCESGEGCASCPSDCGACGCSVSVGEICSTDSECCAQEGISTWCTSDSSGEARCHAECSVGSDCNSGCCAARTDGVYVCAAAEYCADPCGSHYSCGTCSAAAGCGWCFGSGTCRSGTSTGSNDGYCYGSNWAWLSSEC